MFSRFSFRRTRVTASRIAAPVSPQRFIRRFAFGAGASSAVEYAVLLSTLAVFLVGVCLLGSGINGTYARVSSSLPSANADSLGVAATRSPLPTVGTVAEGGAKSGSWQYTALYSLFGACLIGGSTYMAYRRTRQSTIAPAAPERTAEIPFSIQVALFEKRQHLFHALMKDHGGLWQQGLQVRHLMSSDLLTVAPSASREEITQVMREKGIHQLLVCDGDGKLWGIINQRQLCAKRGNTARELLDPPANTTTPDTPANQAITCLILERISCLPVLENERLCGLISATDMLLALQCTLQIWGFFAELLNDGFSNDLEMLQREMAEQSRQISDSRTILRNLEGKNTSDDLRPLFEELHAVFTKLHEFSGKIEHYRSHCLDNVKMVQKLADF
jgi:CBS domain-containing protein